MKTLFINASIHRHGHVAKMAHTLIGGMPDITVNLIDKNIKQIGQQGSHQDDFAKICQDVKKADVVILGTPVYCLDMSGYLKTFIDRMSEILVNHLPNPFYGKKIDLVINYEVNPEAVKHISVVVECECHDMHIKYGGAVSSLVEAKKRPL
ncbi:flavodoxin family protein [Acetilactobacillus jinshanensis]|uniref:flavodoxin family protein n=1 Tax=Acetilactobacillus jinshanensis TaxID=1720083 RepID=UPI0013A60F71|nr:NAD(P)H-dependent oxidoreductase [Acetilactobacillus jinshanensis]URL61207.1 flavodoxin family protein [uncultured bacterium]